MDASKTLCVFHFFAFKQHVKLFSYHGCKKCVKNQNTMSADRYMTCREAYDRTVDRANYLKSRGYEIVEMWECELKEQIQNNPEMKSFFEGFRFKDMPLNPRNGIYTLL